MTDRVCYVYVGLYLCILYGASEPGMGMISRWYDMMMYDNLCPNTFFAASDTTHIYNS